jgi:ABC-type branched-subunit amino acid transport system substrate-binding protein
VKIGVLYLDSGGILYPQTMQILNAYAQMYNAQGGINGRDVVIDGCDGNLSDPTALPNCENKLVYQDKVVAFVADNYDVGLGSIVDKTGIANITGAVNSPDDLTSKNTFMLECSTACGFATFVQQAKLDHLKKVAYLYFSQPGTSGNPVIDALKSQLAAVGTQMVAVSAPATTTNWTSFAAEAKSDGADAVYGAVANQALIALINAASSLAYHPAFYGTIAACDQSVSKAVPTTVLNCDSFAQPYSSSAWSGFRAVMAKYGPSGYYDSYPTTQAYWGAQVLKQILSKIPAGTTVTRANFLAATKQVTFQDPTYIPGNTTDFTSAGRPSDCALDKNWSGHYEFAEKMLSGVETLAHPDPIKVC